MANTKITTSVISADAITGALIADDVALGGNPTTSTQSAGNNTTRIATTAFVTSAIDNLVDSAPGTMNTLNEIAAALNDDANFNTTVTNLIAAKAAISGQTFTGDVQAPGLYVGSTNTSYDFYNNGTSYLNGNVTIDADLSITSAGPSIYLVDSDNNPDYQIKNGNGAFRIIDTTNSADRIHISTTGLVGIGVSNPDDYNSSADNLVVGSSGDTGISIVAGTSNDSTLIFADGTGGTAGYRGRVAYDHASDYMRFDTAATERMRIDTNGKVGIGNTNPSGMHANANMLVVGTGSGDQGMSVYAGTSVGRYAFARALGNNTDAYDGGMAYDGNRNLTFHTNAGSERLRINGSGHIGFGTTTMPSGMNSSSYKQFKIGGAVFADSGHASGHNVEWMNNLYVGSGNDRKFTHAAAAAAIQMTGGKMYFRTHDGGGASADATATVNQRMQIHNNGHVAIGDHSPVGMLDIKGGGYNSIIIGSNRTDNTNKLSGISAYMYTNNQVSLFQNFNQNGNNALYYGSADGAFRGLQDHYFMVNSNYNATSSHTIAMRINSSGKVSIGTSSPSLAGILSVEAGNAGVPIIWAKNTNADSVGIRSQVNSTSAGNYIFAAYNSGGIKWKIRNDGDHQGTDTSIGSLSDSRLKKDVTDLTYDIDKFKQYRPINFNWINPDCHNHKDNNRGFLAQEVKAIDDFYCDKYEASGDDIPLVDEDGMAHGTKFGYKDAMYISVIQQLITRLEAAEARITTLEG